MIETIVALTKRAPWTGRVFSRLKIKEGPSCDVASVTEDTLYYNPVEFAKFTREERIGIAAHEMGHVLMRHAARLQRFEDGSEASHLLSNMAADYAINGLLLEQGYTLPPDALYDPAFDDLGVVAIRRRLELTPKRPEPPVWGRFHPSARKKLYDPDPEKIHDWLLGSGWESTFATEFGLEPAPHSAVRMARVFATLVRNMLPEWQQTWRYTARYNDDLPAWRDLDEPPSIVIALDISGSINEETRCSFLAACASIPIPVTVIAADVDIRMTWKDVRAGRTARLNNELPHRGGGTAFQPAIDYARQKRAALIYLTDGASLDQVHPRGVDIIWVVWGKATDISIPPGSRIIRVEEESAS